MDISIWVLPVGLYTVMYCTHRGVSTTENMQILIVGHLTVIRSLVFVCLAHTNWINPEDK